MMRDLDKRGWLCGTIAASIGIAERFSVGGVGDITGGEIKTNLAVNVWF
jgi:hypothetical protein